MKRKTRLILLTLIGTMIILLIALGFSYAYMKGLIGDGAKSSLSVNNCAKILLTESGSSINLSNTYPMSDNAGLNTTPYTFGIRSTCSGNRGFKLYIVTIAGNTLSANNVKYALTLKGSKEILSSGKVGSLSSGSSDFNVTATNQLSSKVGTVDSIYYTYEDNIALGEVTYYDLYMWVDKDATNSVANQTFTAAVTVLEGEYETSDIALRLAGDITTYDANVSCSGATGAKWNPLNRSVEVLDITKTTARCAVSNKTNTTLDNLKDIVEEAGYEEYELYNYIAVADSNYNMQTPFYTTSFSTSVTSGTVEAGAISWDSTNNYWVSNPSLSSKHYYYLFSVNTPGYYQLCVKYLSGDTTNRVYLYRDSSNMYSSTYFTASSTSESCINYFYVDLNNTIRIDQYTYNGIASIGIYMKSATTSSAGIRYEGQDPNNYVWFNNELWRIIGSIPTKIDSGASTTTTNLVKIIRNNQIGALKRHNSTSRPEWNANTLYYILNSYYLGALDATGTSYCNVGTNTNCDFRYNGINLTDYYGQMVKEVYWNTGIAEYSASPNEMYTYEKNSQISKGVVGLMSASDYGFATSYNRPGRANTNKFDTREYTEANWLYGKGEEWTLTSSSMGSYEVTTISYNGRTDYSAIYSYKNVRPVVYLDPTVYVISGDGTQANPYKLGM